MPQMFLGKEHPSEFLYSDGYACLVWAENPMVGESLTREQYLDLGHVVLQYSRARAAFIDEWFLTKLGVTRRAEVFAPNFNAVPPLVVGTRRIATIQRRLAEFYARYLPLRIIAPPFELPVLDEAIQWHRNFDADPASRWVRSLVLEVAKGVEPALLQTA